MPGVIAYMYILKIRKVCLDPYQCTLYISSLCSWTDDLLWPLFLCISPPVYLFMGLMMMYLLLRTFHKMADLHGLTTFLQLPRCEESDLDEDREPIVESEHEEAPPYLGAKASTKPLEPGSQPSYNTITKGWALSGGGERKKKLWLPPMSLQTNKW